MSEEKKKHPWMPAWPFAAAFLGPRGSGKTSFALNIIHRIDPPPDRIVVFCLRGSREVYRQVPGVQFGDENRLVPALVADTRTLVVYDDVYRYMTRSQTRALSTTTLAGLLAGTSTIFTNPYAVPASFLSCFTWYTAHHRCFMGPVLKCLSPADQAALIKRIKECSRYEYGTFTVDTMRAGLWRHRLNMIHPVGPRAP